jgi:hypothetical protein
MLSRLHANGYVQEMYIQEIASRFRLMPPNGWRISRRERAARQLEKRHDLAREAVCCMRVLGGCASYSTAFQSVKRLLCGTLWRSVVVVRRGRRKAGEPASGVCACFTASLAYQWLHSLITSAFRVGALSQMSVSSCPAGALRGTRDI